MELIKILFFVIGSFFGVEQSQIFSEKTTVTINPTEKTIIVFNENILSLIKTKEDSLKVNNELKAISQSKQKWSKEFKNYSKKEQIFSISNDGETLNSKISLTYNNHADLKAFGIDINKKGQFSMMNFPKHHIKSADGTLGERYWNFDTTKTFTFTLEALTDIPEEFKVHIKSLLPYWKNMKQ
ncbi:hypothetical protein H8K90_11675 [Winogradskyella echinorum]|uniref:DUF4468 domain-containing protein n=1 Tax=Winogradskyella echinorum TaxID=538189 RepID=A0ABR6Y2S9_9FLAO|nr:hypothetical protein [Winogradskyella echinorum]MBC3847043.1 hypothetical protein [Winogradskyella echinorum]MBC5751391.1 hypothetical protein [Winogradskyella echinorum]